VYLHVLARLEALAAHGARVRESVRRVHVEQVLLEVAVVAVALAAGGAGGPCGLTVSVAAVRGVALLGLRLGLAAAPRRSWAHEASGVSHSYATLSSYRAPACGDPSTFRFARVASIVATLS
jgi:hypothetical protein